MRLTRESQPIDDDEEEHEAAAKEEDSLSKRVNSTSNCGQWGRSQGSKTYAIFSPLFLFSCFDKMKSYHKFKHTLMIETRNHNNEGPDFLIITIQKADERRGDSPWSSSFQSLPTPDVIGACCILCTTTKDHDPCYRHSHWARQVNLAQSLLALSLLSPTLDLFSAMNGGYWGDLINFAAFQLHNHQGKPGKWGHTIAAASLPLPPLTIS